MQKNSELSATTTQQFINNYYKKDVTLKSNEVDAVVGYFLKRGFDRVSAINTASILLQQASVDNMSAFQLIDTLKGVSNVQLSNIVAQILNINSSKTKSIGFRVDPDSQLFEQRQILV